jgi:hypothetical protein
MPEVPGSIPALGSLSNIYSFFLILYLFHSQNRCFKWKPIGGATVVHKNNYMQRHLSHSSGNMFLIITFDIKLISKFDNILNLTIEFYLISVFELVNWTRMISSLVSKPDQITKSAWFQLSRRDVVHEAFPGQTSEFYVGVPKIYQREL